MGMWLSGRVSPNLVTDSYPRKLLKLILCPAQYPSGIGYTGSVCIGYTALPYLCFVIRKYTYALHVSAGDLHRFTARAPAVTVANFRNHREVDRRGCVNDVVLASTRQSSKSTNSGIVEDKVKKKKCSNGRVLKEKNVCVEKEHRLRCYSSLKELLLACPLLKLKSSGRCT
ncbi:uncharacterized protein LOC110871200 [Helianthus annuus]|uniref:uncharacterized protein LOC110871200 n=1 Tax=Helianthus annuus TaxID=4232 RepID=UPI001652D5CB|nr:uncharacterized protein LOC110871200 [Helianthus annuus]